MFEIVKNITFTEYKEIINIIKTTYNVDFVNYATASLKRRVERVYNLYNFKNVEEMLAKIKADEEFFDAFLKETSVPTTEMFRDPQMWIDLKEKVLSKISPRSEYKIWVPEITTDEELFTLLIVLYEMQILGLTKIYASTNIQQNIEKIKTGVLDIKKMETNSANYTRHNGDYQLSKYFDLEEKRAIFDQVLLSKVEFKFNNFFDINHIDSGFNLILFRNRMLYYNPNLQNKALDIVYNSLQLNGHLIIGINETMDGSVHQTKYSLISKTENIFKKIR